MTFQSVSPVLYTWDMEATITFYTEVLGFHREHSTPDGGWASLRRDAVNLMVTRPNAHIANTSPAFTGSLYIRTDEVDALWSRVKDKARHCYPLESFSYGMREFGIHDNNGYLIQFGQPI